MTITFGQHTVEVFSVIVRIVNEPHQAHEHFASAVKELQLADEANESDRYVAAQTLNAIAQSLSLFEADRTAPGAEVLGRLLTATHNHEARSAWLMVVAPEHKMTVQEFVSVDAAYVGAASALARDAALVMELYAVDPRQHDAAPLGTFRRAKP